MGNKEPLAVKLALEEWMHWLEGSEQPFLVWTEHKILEYIRSAKRLNSRQARWALFFNRFDFSLSYRPGANNVKPDALSRQYQANPYPPQPENILPSTCIVGSLTWEVDDRVNCSLQENPPLSSCPSGRLFVPSDLCSQVLQWGHVSRIACHPGVRRTLGLGRATSAFL